MQVDPTDELDILRMKNNYYYRLLEKDSKLRERAKSYSGGILFKNVAALKKALLILIDILSILVSVLMSSALVVLIDSGKEFMPLFKWQTALLMTAGVLVIVQSIRYGQYTNFRPFWDEFGEIIKNCVIASIVTALIFLAAGTIIYPAEYVLGASIMMLTIPVGRLLLKRALMIKGIWFVPTVVAGSGCNAAETAMALESNILMGYKVEFLMAMPLENGKENGHYSPDEYREIKDLLVPSNHRYPVVNYSNEKLANVVYENDGHLVIALEANEYEKHSELVNQLIASHDRVSVVPSIKGVPLVGSKISPIFRHDAILMALTNNLSSPMSRFVKRAFDIIASSLLIAGLSPVLAIIAILVRSDGGAAFYGQARVGKNGREFTCLKFRSMCVDADLKLAAILKSDEEKRIQWEKERKLEDDPRVTPIGKILRKYSLDELPQLLNVIKGEMSLVGPRPIKRDELSKYGVSSAYYLAVRPGLTGLWQISGRNDLDYDTRVYLDSWYVRNWTLWYDITILFKSIKIVKDGAGAY